MGPGLVTLRGARTGARSAQARLGGWREGQVPEGGGDGEEVGWEGEEEEEEMAEVRPLGRASGR